MLTLLKDLECYCPNYIGKKDILIGYSNILKIMNPGDVIDSSLITHTIFCDGLLAFPGIIDQHIHIIGGGGEKGFGSRIKEIEIDEIIMAGVTTLVGVLGVDSYTRCLTSLLAKAKGLEIQGISTYIYTGSYAVPTVTITGNITNDIVLIDKIIGTGEIAISDHRSSHPTNQELLNLSSQTHLGGLISGKAGVVHIHVGDGKTGLNPLLELLKTSEFPIEQFVPTHLNRNKKLFNEAVDYCISGGNIDLTAGETIGISVPDAIGALNARGVDLSKVTVSSDANGSAPNIGVSKIQALYDDIKACILNKKISPEISFKLVTENVAKVLKIYPKKGVLQEGSDADILITDNDFNIQKLFCMGNIMLDNGKALQ